MSLPKKLIYFGACLTCLLSENTEGINRFKKTPGNLSVTAGQSVRFTWEVSLDPGVTVLFGTWCRWSTQCDFIIMQLHNTNLNVNRAGIGSRTQAISPFSMLVTQIELGDEGRYKCTLQLSGLTQLTNYARLTVLVRPQITSKSSAAVEVNENTPYTLQCGATIGNPKPMTFIWYKVITNYPNREISRKQDNSQYNLYLNTTGRNEHGSYICRVENQAGNDQYSVFLNVKFRPVITKLDRVTSGEGGAAALYCEGDANPLDQGRITFLWFRDMAMTQGVVSNSRFSIVQPGDKSSRLTIQNVQRDLAGEYYCVGRTNLGTGKPRGTILDVTYRPQNIAIRPAQNRKVSIVEGLNLPLQCHVEANPPPLYTWERTNRILISRSYSPILNLTSVTKWDSDHYNCTAANNFGSITGYVYVDVQYGPVSTNFTINNQTTRYLAIKGTSLTMICVTDSNPDASFSIRKDGQTVSGHSSYYLSSVNENHEGNYECTASNGIGGKTGRATIEFIVIVGPHEISVTSTTSTKNVIQPNSVTLTCRVKGKPGPEIYWQLNNRNVSYNDTNRQIKTRIVQQILKQTLMESQVIVKSVDEVDDGLYKCVAQNYGGETYDSYRLDVQYRPYITKPLTNITTTENKQVEFSCKAKGKPPVTTWRWKLNGHVRLGITTNRLYYDKVKRSLAGLYTCEASNTIGYGKPASAYLIVEYKPQIITRPVGREVNVSVNIVMFCNATGVPKPSILWYKVGSQKLLFRGETLYLHSVGAKEKGQYECRASNSIGTTSAFAELKVNHPPIITTNTPSFTKIGTDYGVGIEVTLLCTVDAYPKANLQWTTIQGTDIVPGTAGYKVSRTDNTLYLKITVSDASKRVKYKCIATNTLGKDSQVYEVKAKGRPDPPVTNSLKAIDELQLTDPPTVKVTLSWIPGFDGGGQVQFTLKFRVHGTVAFQELPLGNLDRNEYAATDLKTATNYEFTMTATNNMGVSDEYMPYLQFTTKAAPLRRGTASVKRYGTSGTEVLVEWTIIDTSKALSVTIRYKKAFDTIWLEKKVAYYKLSSIIDQLERESTYEFQVFIEQKEGIGMPISAGQIIPSVASTPAPRTGLAKEDIIAIVVGIGGFLLILIIIVALVFFKRQKKATNEQFGMKTTIGGTTRSAVTNYTTGSDVVRSSYDVADDDDPFVTESLTKNRGEKHSPPPSYNDLNVYDENHQDGDRHGTFKPPNPVGNTPAYHSFSNMVSSKKQPSFDKEQPVRAQSHTSLNSSNRAAEISRTGRPAFDPLANGYNSPGRLRGSHDDLRDSYPSDEYLSHQDAVGIENPNYRNDSALTRHSAADLDPDDRLATSYREDPNANRRIPRGHSQGGLSTDDDLPSPPPFMRDALKRTPGSDCERVPGSLSSAAYGKGKRKPYSTGRNDSPAHSPQSVRSTTSSRPYESNNELRSGTSTRPYESNNDYIDDGDEEIVGYLV